MRSDEQQQKDLISSMFPQDSSANAMATNNQDFYSGQSTFPNSQNHQDIMENLMGLPSHNLAPNFSLHVQGSRNMLLEQQLKIQQLQQLQQLQHQIFQQQMELISGGQVSGPVSTSSEQRQQLHGLPTPVSSTELRAQPNADFVSPMMLQHSTSYSSSTIPPHELPQTSLHFTQHNSHQQLSNSAPANIAFHMSPLPTDTDFDISPLTSPWLEAYPQQPIASSSSNKRTASPSDDESRNMPSRKRRPSVPTGSRKSIGRSTSTNSTPAVYPADSGRGTGGDVSGDTPSPADLSMPPPANPASVSGSNIVFYSGITAVSVEEELTPVTPASIMKLGRLGVNSSLIPPKSKATDGKGKPRPKIKLGAEKGIKKTSTASPSLKPILPAEGSASGQLQSQPTPYGKKSSHKDAEQKRRDSLKTSFDDLRLLLPPIPLPSDETYSGEPVLPGAMPPRGPPRPGGGPNMNVSKLQLLRCGNDYIRALKGQVERRNREIEVLRREIRRLRSTVGSEDEGEIDLERDLDAAEKEKVTSLRSDIMEADGSEAG